MMNKLRVRSSRLGVAVAAVGLVAVTLMVPVASAVGTSAKSVSPRSAHLSFRCAVVPQAGLKLSAAGSPCSARVRAGTVFSVRLDTGWKWRTPTVSSGVVSLAAITRSTNGVISFRVRAAAQGSATIKSSATIICKPAVACPALARLWTLRVNVTDALLRRTVTAVVSGSGKTYDLRVGDHLALNLVGPASYTWRALASTAPGVLKLITSTTGATLSSQYLATKKGITRITAHDTPNCAPACLPPSRLFQITVVVT